MNTWLAARLKNRVLCASVLNFRLSLLCEGAFGSFYPFRWPESEPVSASAIRFRNRQRL